MICGFWGKSVGMVAGRAGVVGERAVAQQTFRIDDLPSRFGAAAQRGTPEEDQ